jgi:hypothetical protein
MTKAQRYRYEMFGRVDDFGTANVELFPASSKGGQMFAEVRAAVTAVGEHLKDRDLARAEARRVKATTRRAVTDYMKVIAATARRVTFEEPVPSPFRRGGSNSNAALLAKARLFIDEAKTREARFVEFGMPPTFISDFTALVDQLAEAVSVRNNGRAWRQRAQMGIEAAIVKGTEAIQNLDVIVPNALRLDPVRTGHWMGARRIQGVRSSTSSSTSTPSTVARPADPPAPAPTTPVTKAS